jgi:hypothetical protein
MDNMVGDLIDERHVAAESPNDDPVHVGPVVGYQCAKCIEGRNRRVGVSECHPNDDARYGCG